MKKNIFNTITLLILVTSTIVAHDLDINVTFNYPTVISRCLYGPGEPAKNANISVFSPSGSEKPYQTGKTDQAGYFTIIPDIGGEWLIKADDGHGHLEQMKLTISDQFLNTEFSEKESQTQQIQTGNPTETQYSKPQIPTVYKIIFGLSLVFGLTGFFYGYKARQTNKK